MAKAKYKIMDDTSKCIIAMPGDELTTHHYALISHAERYQMLMRKTTFGWRYCTRDEVVDN